MDMFRKANKLWDFGKLQAVYKQSHNTAAIARNTYIIGDKATVRYKTNL